MSKDVPFQLGPATCIHETARAILVRLDDEDSPAYDSSDDGKIWLPQASIHEDSEVWKLEDEGELVVHSWFARKSNWTEE